MSGNANHCINCGAKLSDFSMKQSQDGDIVAVRSHVEKTQVGSIKISPTMIQSVQSSAFTCTECNGPATGKCSGYFTMHLGNEENTGPEGCNQGICGIHTTRLFAGLTGKELRKEHSLLYQMFLDQLTEGSNTASKKVFKKKFDGAYICGEGAFCPSCADRLMGWGFWYKI